jgi:hypothetical protein
MVPAGTILTYQAKGRSGYFQGESDLVQELNIQFAQNHLVMRDYHSSWTSITGAVDAYLGGPSDFQFTATIQTNGDFNAVGDISSIADHAIYQVTGTMPASTVPNMTIPGQAPADTGQPGQVAPKLGSSPFDLSSLFQSGVNSFALLMVGVILAVVLIVAGKSRSFI